MAGSGQGMRLIETTNGKVLAFLQSSPLRWDYHSALSPDGRWVVSAYPNMQVGAMYFVRLSETASGREVANVVCYGLPPVVAFSPDGDPLAIAANSGLRLIETASGTARARVDRNFLDAAFNPGRWLAVGENEAAGQASAALIETATGTEVARVEHDGPVGAVAFSPDGRLLATASTTGTAPAPQSTVRLLRVNP
jgi:WD40 repeat protein